MSRERRAAMTGHSESSAATATTMPAQSGSDSNALSACSMTVELPRAAYCFGTDAENRRPLPAAGMTTK
jgi:hypothetical protein